MATPKKKPTTPAKKVSAPKVKPAVKKSAPKSESMMDRVGDAIKGGIKNVEGAGKAIGAAYDKSQEARRGIWKNVQRSDSNS
jgi:hypothetical protein